MKHSIRHNRRTLWLSASVLAIAAASAASAQNMVLTPGTDYDIYALAGHYTTVELTSGTSGYLIQNHSETTPAGGVGIFTNGGIASAASLDPAGSFHNISWSVSTTSAPQFVVDKGASLTVIGSGYNIASMFQAAGDVTFRQGSWSFFEANSFLGNLTFEGKSDVKFGDFWWGCCEFASAATFGPSANLALNDSTISFRQYGAGSTINIGGNISGSAIADIELVKGALIVNGSDASKVFAGTINVGGGATFTVGDSTHASAVFGNSGVNTAKINIATVTSKLTGYGTIDGVVTNNGVVKAGGTSGVAGNLTINGSYTQAQAAQLYVGVTPTGPQGLIVNGTAMLNGEMILAVSPGTYGNGVYPILTATHIVGDFVTVSTTGAVSGAMVGMMKSSTGYTLVTEKGTAAQVFGHLAYANRTSLTNFVNSAYDAMVMTPASGAKIDTWLTPTGALENVSRDGLGYENKTYGVSLGGMHRFAAHGGVVGAAFSYRHGNMTVKDDPTTASTNGYDLAVYGGADVNELRFEGSAFYNLTDAHTNRPMGSFGTSQADVGGYAYGVSGQMSHAMLGGLVAPYLRVTYARIHMDGAKETGSTYYDLAPNAINLNTVVTDLGIRAHLLRPEPGRRLKIDADVAWQYDLSDTGETVTGGFANFSGGTSVSYWAGDSKNALRVGLSATGEVTDQIEAYSRVGGTLTSHRRAGELAVGVKYKF
ncbi:autotransporter outer membrane beta-barrel domain-containing protein [Rhizomicrobium electricum]|uniref:Autotransporter domain-containing protein n=1 Tax=Rhizomicrobium electricum TaxID=480070 RepID=A0ABP3PV78_9PROT|nr:autotransporter outer membrane beta-barrel domain-containing protein [Rhizomicrobium electricum]NIJ49060.1 uncharacterized protein with beta-barrel porin domain [Rhizomicrobium electricum]